GAITVGAFALWGGAELLKSHLASSTCRWCGVDDVDWSVRNALHWDNTGAANLQSNIGAYAIVPVAGLGVMALVAAREDRLGEMGGNTLVVAESVALAGDLSQIFKF